MAAVVNTGVNLLRKQTGFVGIAYIRISNYSTEPQAYNLASLKRGTGGRSSFSGIVATVFGATGFIGRYVCNRLGKIGSQIIIPYRGDAYDTRALKLCGDLGQVLFQPFHIKDEKSIEKAVRYSNVVINLIGRDWETRNFKFADVHVDGARRLARIAKTAGVERFIHLSALNCHPNPTAYFLPNGSGFLSSKYHGEQAVLEEFPEATILRPADVYGQEDRFLRYYAGNWRRQGTWMPLWKKGECTIKQPLYVSDLATGIINAIKDSETAGKIYQAVGPKRYYLSDLVDWCYELMRRNKDWGYWRYDMRYDPLFQMKVTLTFKVSPGFPVGNLHWERIERECVTDTILRGVPTLEDLGVDLMPIENQAPWELKPYTQGMYHDVTANIPFPTPPPPRVVLNA